MLVIFYNKIKMKIERHLADGIKKIIEALLFAVHPPLNAKQLQKIFSELEIPSLKNIEFA